VSKSVRQTDRQSDRQTIIAVVTKNVYLLNI